MKISHATRLVLDLMASPQKRPLMFWGAPGIGKSAFVRQAAEAQGRRMLDWRLVQKEAIDITGLPFIDQTNFTTRYASPEMLPKPGEGAVLFLDEIVQAPTMVQNAVSELVLDRSLGGGTYRLPDDACIVAAGNRRTDRAGTFEMPTHMRSRFRHFDIEADVEDFVKWAFKNNIREDVIAFVRFRPNLLFNFDSNDRVTPSPRTWAAVSDDMEFASENPSLDFDVFRASLGDGAATEFVGYLRTLRDMPDPDDVFSNPDGAPIPDQPGIMYALMTVLSARVVKKTGDAFFTYLDRISQDFAVMAAMDALNRDPSLLTGRKATAWATKNAKFMV